MLARPQFMYCKCLHDGLIARLSLFAVKKVFSVVFLGRFVDFSVQLPLFWGVFCTFAAQMVCGADLGG